MAYTYVGGARRLKQDLVELCQTILYKLFQKLYRSRSIAEISVVCSYFNFTYLLYSHPLDSDQCP